MQPRSARPRVRVAVPASSAFAVRTSSIGRPELTPNRLEKVAPCLAADAGVQDEARIGRRAWEGFTAVPRSQQPAKRRCVPLAAFDDKLIGLERFDRAGGRP